MQNLYKKILRDIKFLRIRSASYYNKKRLKGPRLKKRDKVYFLRRNIEIIRLSNKLNYKKFRLFRVKRNIRNISYKLELSKIIRIYLIFYILLLELADLDILERPALKLYLDT
jgi:hypothetical protein